jgi:hypothetical protein
MKAMLEARIVAASTQRPVDFEHGAIAGRDRITFSSQGSPKIANISPAYHCSHSDCRNGLSELIFVKRAVWEIKLLAELFAE